MTRPLLILFLSLGSVLANSRSVETISLPSPESVVAFTNGLPPATGTRDIKSREDITRFLKDGSYTSKTPSPEDELALCSGAPVADGIFTDKGGRFYYWTLISPTRLWLRTPEGGGAILVLPHS